MQLYLPREANEKTKTVTILQRNIIWSNCMVRKRSSPSNCMAAFTISGESGRVCSEGFAKVRCVPFMVSLTRGFWDGGWHLKSWWKWFTAATICETEEFDFFDLAKAEITTSKSMGLIGNGESPCSSAKDTKLLHSDAYRF